MEYRCVLKTTSYVQYHWRLYVAFSKDCASLWLCKMELSQIYFFLQSPQLPLLLSLLQYTWISLSLYLSLCVSLPLPFCVSLSNELEISQTISVFFQFRCCYPPPIHVSALQPSDVILQPFCQLPKISSPQTRSIIQQMLMQPIYIKVENDNNKLSQLLLSGVWFRVFKSDFLWSQT